MKTRILCVFLMLLITIPVFGQAAPTKTSPINNSIWETTTPTFTWYSTPGSYVTYNLEVATTSSFGADTVFTESVSGWGAGQYTADAGDSLETSTTYYWRVQVDGGTWSSTWSFTTTEGIGSLVPALSSPPDGADWITTTPTLTWWYVTSVNVTYYVQVDDGDFSGSKEVDTSFTGGATSSLDVTSGAGLTGGTKYYWRVSTDSTNWSEVWDFTPATASTGAGTSVPALSAPADGAAYVTTTPTLYWWYTTSSNVTYYVQVDDGDFSGSKEVDTSFTAGATSNYSIPGGAGLTGGTKYYWRVSTDSTNWSEVWDFTPPSTASTTPVPILTAPVNGVTYGEGTVPVLYYYSIGTGITYRIQIDTDSLFSSPTVINTSSTNYTFTGYVPGTTYYWRVSSDAGSNYSGYWSFNTGGTAPSTSVYDYFVSYIDGDDIVNDGMTPTTPYQTIAWAITQAVDGESIYVFPWTYTENLTIAEELTLHGATASGVIIEGDHTITSSTVSLDRFTFDATGTAITIDASGSTIDDVDITNCVFELPSPGIGIYLGGASAAFAVTDITIDNNTFNGPSSKISNPFKIGGDFSGELGVDIDGVYFTDNTVSYGSIPINLYDENINDVLIDGNTFTNTDGVVYVWSMAESAPTGVLSNFVFINNFVDATNTYGVGLGLDLNDASPGTGSDFVDANYGTGIAINNNSFVDVPGGYQVEAVSLFGVTSYVLDATNNWWGDSNGPGGDDDSGGVETAVGTSSEVNSLAAEQINWYPFEGSTTASIIIETLTGKVGGATVNVDVDLNVVPGFTGITNIIIGKFHFNSSELDFLYANYGTGTLINTAGWMISFYDPIPGEVGFTAVGSTPISSDGELFSLNFQIIATSAGTDDITATISEWYIDGVPSSFSITNGGITWTDAPSPSDLRGDATLDYAVTIDDATAIINHVYGWSVLTDAQALINAAAADGVAGITFDDALAVYSFVVYGYWDATPAPSPSIQSSVKFDEVVMKESDLVEFPLQVVNGVDVQSVEVRFYYDSEFIDYQTFAAMILENDKFTNALELSEGIAQFSFASVELLNGTFNAGTVTLRFKDGILPVDSEIRIAYSINSGEYVDGPTYKFGNITDTDDFVEEIPTSFYVSQNYPNPFNPATAINYSLPEALYISIKIYDILGREVKTLVQSDMNAGTHVAYWNGDNNLGGKVASGTYIYRVIAGNNVVTKKMVLLK
ncbi:T9SS type A sorting domain-containing protein [Bacteroidota bacterium]